MNILDVMHSSFTRQFIFELIPFIILFSTREMKFIDIDSASNFFNSVIGRSMIGMIAFTFVTYSLSTVNPNRIGDVITDPSNSIRLNSFTNINNSKDKKFVESYEKLLPYATI
jgi:branched-subunit amino acid transport protein AzlD